MVDIICDTSFLIHLATRRIKNIDRIDTDIGSITFLVPDIVDQELISLKDNLSKQADVEQTIHYIRNFKRVKLHGSFADQAILNYISKNGGIVATIDKELKLQIKAHGSTVLSFANDRIVLEPLRKI